VKPLIDLPGRSRRSLSPPGPGEWLLVLLIVAVGCGMRFAWPDRMAIEHFDEGVYASNVWFGPDDSFRYPEQHLYAPPLLPTVIEWIFTLAGPSNFGAMLPSLIAGSLTVPLVWWVGRCWFGPVAGLAAAALCAFSDAHVVFSRSALTDVLLCFWVLVAVHLAWRAMTTGRLWPTVGAGLFTGLAWWTKYNGWLPIAICVAGLIPWLIQERVTRPEPAARRGLVRPISRLVALSAIAFAIWSPWLWSLQSRGGYATVAANHRKYVVGISGWWSSAIGQILKLSELSGTATLNALLIAFLISLAGGRLTAQRFTWNRPGRAPTDRLLRFLPILLLMAAGQLILGPGPVYLGASALGLALLHIRSWRDRERGPATLAAWLLVAWFVGMTISTPAYTPYPRLLLPWQMATWLAVGVLIQRIVLAVDPEHLEVSHENPLETEPPSSMLPNSSESRVELTNTGQGFLHESGAPSRLRLAALFAVSGALLAIVEYGALPLWVPGWEDRGTIQSAAKQFERVAIDAANSTVGADRSFVVYTISEPALLFQLRLLGLEHVRPLSSLRLANPDAPRPVIPTFVAIGRQARATPGFQSEQWDWRLNSVAKVQVTPSPLVRLDGSYWAPPRGPDWSVLTLFKLD
jgi:4-amino-4-deoxy-L-arabinose transferase-like glycosyltransferase